MKEFIQELSNFCQKEIEPSAYEDDQKSNFRLDIFQKLGELGLTGMTVPESAGGSNLGYEEFTLALEELAKYSVSYAVTVSVSSMVANLLEKFANEKQKKTYLPKLAMGNEIGAFALSEPSSGSDAASLKLEAKRKDKGYLLNGQKMWITSAGVAKTYIVMARTGGEGPSGISAFIVRKDDAGVYFGKKEEKMGWKVSPTCEIFFQDVFLPDDRLIGQEGEGFKMAMAALDRGRITIGAIACGLSQRALDEAIRFALQRQQFGKNIFEFQGLQFMMADMATEIESSKALVKSAAQAFDAQTPDIKLASMAKLKSTDTAMKVTTDAVQILGGVGYTTEFPLERFMRDAKVLQIVEGTNQIQRVVIARELKKMAEK